MKKTLKIYSRVLALVLTILLAWQCQTEEVTPESIAKNPNLSVIKFTSSEIPDIVSSFQKKIEHRRNDINAKAEPTFWVDEKVPLGSAIQ